MTDSKYREKQQASQCKKLVSTVRDTLQNTTYLLEAKEKLSKLTEMFMSWCKLTTALEPCVNTRHDKSNVSFPFPASRPRELILNLTCVCNGLQIITQKAFPSYRFWNNIHSIDIKAEYPANKAQITLKKKQSQFEFVATTNGS